MHIQDREHNDLKMSLNAESDLASGSGCLQPDCCKLHFSKVRNLARVELIFTGGALLNFRSLLQSKMVLELFDKAVTIFLIMGKAACCLPWPLQKQWSVLVEIVKAEIWIRKLQSVF